MIECSPDCGNFWPESYGGNLTRKIMSCISQSEGVPTKKNPHSPVVGLLLESLKVEVAKRTHNRMDGISRKRIF
ncbi:unnamed protein product [Allacma fusca]|uniref:Uncharacterized protein n=1 Tax=Allacma fusca TaxID=39272 RepID=A0A8J2JHY5_9HEXA|nr:unnamed protein product [Allacma fusca]